MVCALSGKAAVSTTYTPFGQACLLEGPSLDNCTSTNPQQPLHLSPFVVGGRILCRRKVFQDCPTTEHGVPNHMRPMGAAGPRGRGIQVLKPKVALTMIQHHAVRITRGPRKEITWALGACTTVDVAYSSRVSSEPLAGPAVYEEPDARQVTGCGLCVLYRLEARLTSWARCPTNSPFPGGKTTGGLECFGLSVLPEPAPIMRSSGGLSVLSEPGPNAHAGRPTEGGTGGKGGRLREDCSSRLLRSSRAAVTSAVTLLRM